MFSFVSAMAIMSAMGCATRYALLKAGKHDKEADAVFAHGLVAALLQSLLLLVAGLFSLVPSLFYWVPMKRSQQIRRNTCFLCLRWAFYFSSTSCLSA